MPRFHVTSLGETMLRLSVPAGRRLEDARQLDLEIGGSESNTCVALARLDRRVGWISRLPDSPLGNAVVRTLAADRIDVSAVRRAPGERLGVYFIEYAGAPRAIRVLYDRADSACARMTPADVDWAYLLDTRVLHLSGITPALSDTCRDVVSEAIARARSAGVPVSFDVNYRALLWPPERARAVLRPLAAAADILFCKAADARELFDCTGDERAVVEGLRALGRATTVVATFGAGGAAILAGGRFLAHPAVAVRIVDRIGSGDAFSAGVLDGVLDGDPAAGLDRGLALAAIALSQHGDRVLTSRAELERVLARRHADVVR